MSPELADAWRRALTVTEHEVAAYVPTNLDAEVAEALLEGYLQADRIAEKLKRGEAEVKAILSDPVAMAFISKAMYQVIQHRLAVVDAAMFTRAVSGDVSAAKLVYERVNALRSEKTLNVKYSGGVNLTALTDDDLKRILYDKEQTLPAEFKVIESKKVEDGA